MEERQTNICAVDEIVNFNEVFTKQLAANEHNIYWILYTTAKQLIKQYREARNDEEKAINIENFADFLGIKIVERPIAGKEKLFRDEVEGFIDHFDYGEGYNQCMIYVNENLGELSKRYVIGHEIAHYILNNGEQKNIIEYCRKVMLSGNIRERICDMMVSFICMPIESVMKSMLEFCRDKKEKGAIPIEPDEWLHYLGYEFKLSNYHTVLCYQDIRNLAGVLNEMGYMEQGGEYTFEDKEIDEHLSEYKQLFG